MLMKYKDFKMLSKDDMKQILGGTAPGGGGAGDSCRVVCKNNITYDCFSNTAGSCNQGCSATDGVSCTGYNSDCKKYTLTCDAA
jgi:hypothetical protein